MDNSYIPETAAEWYKWLSSEDTKTTNSYLAKPTTLIANYRSEIATTHDYEGREILELLQNAADQAKESKIAGDVRIELWPEGLVVANNGAAFSVGGVLSLENAYLSPKHHNRKQYIGNKGLGFRAVLNWTQAPIILSGALSLAYSKLVSQNKLGALVAASTEMFELVEEERGKGTAQVIPILPFPGYSKNGDISDYVEDNGAIKILGRLQELRDQGFTTAIGMPFDSDKYFEIAQKQIQTLRPEILLFVDHLNRVTFLVDGEENSWTLEGNDSAALVLSDQEPLGIWQIHRTQGEVPDSELDRDQQSPLNYELIVALPEIETLEELHVSPLFSHFPTTITLPLPVVCHATLELDQSRNHIQKRNSNRYVFEQLAIFLAEVAETRSKEYQTGPKAGYRLLMPRESYHNDLQRSDFPECLRKAAAERAIVPTLGGDAVLAKDALSLSGANDSWLPRSDFFEVVPVTQAFQREEDTFFKSIGVQPMGTEDLRQRLLGLTGLSLPKRVELVSGIINHRLPKETHSSSLLLATKEQSVPDDADVFIAPQGGEIPILPDWLTLRFLNNDMRLELNKRLGVKEVRELQGKLSTFGVREYSFASLISRLVGASNQRKKENPTISKSIDNELLNTVFTLFCAEGQSGKRPTFPEKVSLPLPTQDGSDRDAESLYLGRGYGIQGNIVQELYESWAPELLVAEPLNLGISGTEAEIASFLEWLGVARWPRMSVLEGTDAGYMDYVLDRIQYPAKFEEYFFDSRQKVVGARINEIKTIEGLEPILANANSVAIASWLVNDVRASEWARMSASHANLTAIKGFDRNKRQYHGLLPCYIRWKLESTEWLLGKEGNHLRPKDCVLGERAIEALFPRPVMPEHEKLHLYGISAKDLVDGWRHAGVLTSLAELEMNDIYLRLFELPERQPDGKSAPSLYRWLLNAVDSAISEGSDVRERFIAKGRMWGHCGSETGYFPVSELHHADSEGLPDALLNRLKIVDLPHRVGAGKVKKVFGVEPIDRVAIKQKMKDHSLAGDLDQEFQKAKPYFYKLRASQSSQTQHVSTLKSLRLKVCSELYAEMEYGGDKFDFELPIWGWFIDDSTLYIRYDPAEIVERSSDLLADAIGIAIASIFRIGDGGEFARMFLCKEKNRRALLKRMRGEVANEDMDQIIVEFSKQGEGSPIDRLSEIGPIEEPRSDEIEEESDDSLVNVASEKQESEPPEQIEESELDANEPLIVEMVEHHPQDAPNKQKLRIKRRSKKNSKKGTSYRITDSDFTERKVMEVESSFTPARYPLLVGQLTGSDAFGCDILSFDSEEKRDNFKSGENRDLGLVERFIEVKGRKHEGAEIELRGNEKDAAVNYGKRYYLYRLTRSGENEFTLSILRDPYDATEALEASVYVHLNRAKELEEYEVSGGLAENGVRAQG